jgi:hypothetical protein
MIDKTFQIIKGIGPVTEKKLWELGFKNWNDIIQSTCPENFSSNLWEKLVSELPAINSALSNFEIKEIKKYIPKKLRWQLIPNFLDQIAFLDIETTGLFPSDSYITTIAVYDGNNIYNFIRGQNLDEFPEFIENYKAITTFNGKQFDVPFIKQEMNIDIPHIHFDLRFLLHRLGYSGGLKKIEKKLGINRGNLKDLDGYCAVLLWNNYKRTKNDRYLQTLLAYNNEDVINLEILLYKTFNGLIKKYKTPFQSIELNKKPFLNPIEPDMDTVNEIFDIYKKYS